MQIGSSALTGMRAAELRVETVARRLAGMASPAEGGDTVDLSAEMVALVEARDTFRAGVALLKTEDQMQRALLDVLG